MRVCEHCARACELYARARARHTRAQHACTVPAHRTRALYANRTRGLYAKSVRQNLLCFFQHLLPFVNLLRFFKICGNFLHVRSAVRYGARARTMCARARARARTVRAERARAVRTHRARAHCTYRTRTVRPDCTQKVCAKICCVFFKICCVCFQNLLCFFKICCVFFVRAVRAYGGRTARRARAPCTYVRLTRARENRTRAHRARALYRLREPYSRTVRKMCVPNFAVLFSISDAFFSKSVAFFFQICGVLFARTVRAYGGRTVWHALVRCARTCGAHARACTVYRARARCTCAERAVRVYGARETHVCCAASAFSC